MTKLKKGAVVLIDNCTLFILEIREGCFVTHLQPNETLDRIFSMFEGKTHEVVGLSLERIEAEYMLKSDCLCSQHIEEKAGLRRRVVELEAKQKERDEKLIQNIMVLLDNEFPGFAGFLRSRADVQIKLMKVFAEVK
jgi:hypothetical protein